MVDFLKYDSEPHVHVCVCVCVRAVRVRVCVCVCVHGGSCLAVYSAPPILLSPASASDLSVVHT